MPENTSYLIIGNGIAGVTASEMLRNEDPAADITVIADDPFPVYYRPALKDYLAGRVREDKLWARPNSFYQDHRIRFLSDRVVGIRARMIACCSPTALVPVASPALVQTWWALPHCVPLPITRQS